MKPTTLLGTTAISLFALLGAGCVNAPSPKVQEERQAVENPAPNAEEKFKDVEET